jgi:hypothetical protein
VSLVAVSRGPLNRLLAYRARMGWTFPWASSLGSDFNYDYHARPSPPALAPGAPGGSGYSSSPVSWSGWLATPRFQYARVDSCSRSAPRSAIR